MTQALPILLLAAGQSRRMQGRDKLMEPVEGVALLRRMAQRAIAAGLGPVYVTLPPPPHPRYAALSGLELTPVEVPDAASGLSASLRRGFSALPPQAGAAMILLCDLPELTTEDLKNIAQSLDLNSENMIWRGTSETGAPGHPVVIAQPLFDEVQTLTGDHGAQPLLRRHADRVVKVALPGDHAICDLDTPEAWAAWRARQDTAVPAP
ncbi:nucleotidyltransferase family protein [Pseudodonghicola flavimaris]|uniref:Nucleotidyltransferase family protein n=1 Tax=Pseudodonghicola flavimaris TaxID=3050036 RepID=A0ABT7F7S1_9RHOB|nr:nucleotidyltransferase family protein [Pseudodonghicola flavimaris]MDK3020666.1 nucleotidyltransferase family protein [Pseudodonghicola flavimaris]